MKHIAIKLLGMLGVITTASLMGAGEASAITVSQTQNFSGTPSFEPILTFDQFDDQGGTRTLNSITFDLNLNISDGQLSVDNDGGDPASVDVALGASTFLNSNDVTLLDDLFNDSIGTVSVSNTANFELAPDIEGEPDAQIDGNGDDATLIGDDLSTSSSGSIRSQFFSDYIGTGTYDIEGSVNQVLQFDSEGGISGTFTPVSTVGDLTVTYDYTDNPSPVPFEAESSIALALLAGWGAWKRWKNRRAMANEN